MKYFFVKTTLFGNEIIKNVYDDLDSALSKMVDRYIENNNSPYNYIDAFCGYYYVIEVNDDVTVVNDFIKATSNIFRLYVKDTLLLMSKHDKTNYKTRIFIMNDNANPNTFFRLQTVNNLYKKEKIDLLNDYKKYVSKDINSFFILYPTLIKDLYLHRLAEFETKTFFL